MDKLKLNLEALKVETFDAGAPSEHRGTVEARELFETAAPTCAVTRCRTGCVSSPCVCL